MHTLLPFSTQIGEHITTLLQQAKQQWPPAVAADDYLARLEPFAKAGKMLRGNLSVMTWLAYQPSGTQPSATALQLGALLELIETGILLQDDVVDGDQLRRGGPTFHRQYAAWAKQHRPSLSQSIADQFGESWAFFIGDLLYFYCFGRVLQLEAPVEHRIALARTMSDELVSTASGQLGDLLAGFAVQLPTEAEVTEINRQKTARYSTCLPMLTGAQLAGVAETEFDMVEQLAEQMGQLFQLTDDRLDLFSTAEKSGKSQGSDVRQGKRTMLYFLTDRLTKQTPAMHQRFHQLYGNLKISEAELVEVQTIMQDSGAYAHHEQLLDSFYTNSHKLIAQLDINNRGRKHFAQVLEFLRHREH